MRKKLSQADVGRALGVSRQRVFALTRRGMPLVSIAAARAWRAENLDADTMKPGPQGRAPEAPASAELKHRLLAANVRILETKAAHENALDLPSDKVERGVMTGLQLLRASINGSTSAMYADFVAAIREGRTPAIDGVEALRSVELIQAIYRSARTGRRMRLSAPVVGPRLPGSGRSALRCRAAGRGAWRCLT